jgi:signal-transduction protein with cAMP-binding, CBS, and nucleotidyltransferase domain
MVDLAQALARCGLFRGFDEARLSELSRTAQAIILEPGALLFREGDPGDAMYVVLEGAVQVYTQGRTAARWFSRASRPVTTSASSPSCRARPAGAVRACAPPPRVGWR